MVGGCHVSKIGEEMSVTFPFWNFNGWSSWVESRCNIATVCRRSSSLISVELLARVDVLHVQTRLALDVAAPVEATVAAFDDAPRLTVVAAATAQLAACVRVARAPLTSTAVRPRRPGHRWSRAVRLAVVRRRVDVDQVVLGRTPPAAGSRPPASVIAGALPSFLRPGRDRKQRRAVRVERHPSRAVVPPPQPSTDLPERCQLVPAGARTTRSGHPVALARRLRIAVNRLSHRPHLLAITAYRNRPNRWQ